MEELKKKILENTKNTKEKAINTLQILDNQNELITKNYNKVNDIDSKVEKSSSIIKKIKRKWCCFFKKSEHYKNNNENNKNNITSKSLNNNSDKIKNSLYSNNSFEEELISHLSDLENITELQSEQIKNQNNILENMHNNTRIERMRDNLHHRKTDGDSTDERNHIANVSRFPFGFGSVKDFKGEENHHDPSPK